MTIGEADIAVVGAGAAGLMTAIWAARGGARVVLFDTRQKIGAKILISGGTRCNVTNLQVTPSDYHGAPSHFLKHVLEAFTPAESIHFFESLGVPLVLEPTGKYFPTTHSGQTVLAALLKEIGRLNVGLRTGICITSVKKSGDGFQLNGQIFAKRVVLTTGGLSYPETGSDGTGFGIAESLGHTIVQTAPALTPLTTDDEDWKSLSGVTMDVKLSFYNSGKKKSEQEGSFLFTHFGFSGPAALDISRHFALSKKEDQPEIKASFLPKFKEESLKKHFIAAQKKTHGKFIKNFLTDEFSLPARFVEILLKKLKLDEKASVRRVNDPLLGQLTHSLLNCALPVTGVVGYKKAEVTAGGVDLREIKVSTMESRLLPGLYFAGEILDMDGRIGGFNFQWAWSSGALAGRSAARSLDCRGVAGRNTLC